jgi:hypothetical protein
MRLKLDRVSMRGSGSIDVRVRHAERPFVSLRYLGDQECRMALSDGSIRDPDLAHEPAARTSTEVGDPVSTTFP